MTHKLVWHAPQADLERAETVLCEIVYPPADAVSLVKDEPIEADADSAWSLHGYFENAPDRDAIDTAMATIGLALPPPTVEELPEQDWVAHALSGLGIVKAGDFVLFGQHDADEAAGMDGIPLLIDANRAFGTGHHPTTAGCLEALTRLGPNTPAAVLDIGTGSGVLAIAARKLWADATIIGTDIDQPSVDIAIENAALNGTRNLRFEHADGLGDLTKEVGPFPLILANILADPLIGLAPEIADALAPGGTIVLAGLLTRQRETVLEAYQNVGMTLVDEVTETTWPVLILRSST